MSLWFMLSQAGTDIKFCGSINMPLTTVFLIADIGALALTEFDVFVVALTVRDVAGSIGGKLERRFAHSDKTDDAEPSSLALIFAVIYSHCSCSRIGFEWFCNKII